MKLGIIGRPQSGKTTVFNAAAGQQAVVGDFSQAVHRAVIKVPDERLERLAEIVKPKKTTLAEIEFLDAAGFTGKGKHTSELQITPDLQQMDAFIAVVDVFTSEADPESHVRSLVDEMILFDQAMVENSIEKRERKVKLTGDKSEMREMELLKRCLSALEDEKPLIDLELGVEEEKTLRGYQLLTRKPRLIALNIAEESLGDAQRIFNENSGFISAGKQELAVLCGKVEAELVVLEEAERQEFTEALGIATSAMQLVIQKSYALLGLISFFTTSGPELRAWPIRLGSNVLKAADTVHTDMARGFIRAEVVSYQDFVEYETAAALKAAGKMRLEGKEYVVADGDVILFRFNV